MIFWRKHKCYDFAEDQTVRFCVFNEKHVLKFEPVSIIIPVDILILFILSISGGFCSISWLFTLVKHVPNM